MASMRTLHRRLLRWHRYAQRTCWNPRVTRPAWMGPAPAINPGHTRAWNALQHERERRLSRPRCRQCGCTDDRVCAGGCAWAEPGLCTRCAWGLPGGWYDDPDDSIRCCTAGDDGHPGPCVTTCEACGGDGRCPDCGGLDDLGCPECEGTGACGWCDGGEIVEDDYVPSRTVVTINTGGLT